MTRFSQHTVAAIAALFITVTSFTAVVNVPAAEAATVVALPVLA